MSGPDSATRRPTPFRTVFAVAEFRALFAFQFLRVSAEVIAVMALTVLVYSRTASAFASAATFVAGMLPQVVGGAFLTSLADRLRPRPLLAGLAVCRLTITAVLALGMTPVPVAILLLMVMGLFSPLTTAAAQALLRDLLTDDGGYVLGRSLFTMTMAGAQVAGHASGGLLLLWLGPPGILWVSAGMGLLAAGVVRFGLRDRPARSGQEEPGSPNVLSATWRANRRLLADRTLRGLFLAQWLPFSLAVGAEAVIVPYAADRGNAEWAGFLYASMAAGLLAGNLVLGRLVAPARQEALALPVAFLTGGCLLLFALQPGLVPALVIALVGSMGFAYELGLQRRFADAIPAELSGQAFGLLSTGIMAGQAVCILAAGALAEVLSPGTVMALSGAASMISALFLTRHLRPPPRPRPLS